MAAKDSTPVTEYKCAHCARTLPLSAFPLVKPGKLRRPNRRHRCADCARAYKHQHYLKNAGAARNRFRPKDPEASKDRQRKRWAQYRAENLEHVRRTEAAYRERKRAECNARIAAWKAANPHQASKHRVAKLHAIPVWADTEKIADLYREAKRRSRETGDRWHVDHVVPLNSPLVCGLHCEANLAVIHWRENLSKKNRYWPDMP